MNRLQSLLDTTAEKFDKYFDGHWGWNLPAEHIGLIDAGVGIPSSEKVKEYVKPFLRASQLEVLEAVREMAEAKMSHYEKESWEHRNEDRIILAYDFDSRYVAMKHFLSALDLNKEDI